MGHLEQILRPVRFLRRSVRNGFRVRHKPRFVDTFGKVNYADTDDEARVRHIYDFVDDNDDNDRKNDLQRRFR